MKKIWSRSQSQLIFESYQDILTNEDDAVEPALGVGVEAQIALRRRQNEGHGHDVHLLAGAHEAAHHQQEIVEPAVP